MVRYDNLSWQVVRAVRDLYEKGDGLDVYGTKYIPSRKAKLVKSEG